MQNTNLRRMEQFAPTMLKDWKSRCLMLPIGIRRNEKSRREVSLRTFPRDEQKCIPACKTFYMSCDKHVKRLTSAVLHSSQKCLIRQ